MLIFIYIVGILACFHYLCETQAAIQECYLSQRDMSIILPAAVLWPLTALLVVWGDRKEIGGNMVTLADSELIQPQVVQEILDYVTGNPEEFQITEVDEETL